MRRKLRLYSHPYHLHLWIRKNLYQPLLLSLQLLQLCHKRRSVEFHVLNEEGLWSPGCSHHVRTVKSVLNESQWPWLSYTKVMFLLTGWLCRITPRNSSSSSKTFYAGTEGWLRCRSNRCATSVLEVGGWSTPCPHHCTSGKGTPYPFYRRLGGLRGWSRQARKILPPLGFDPQTIQPVVSRYPGCVIPAAMPVNTIT